MSLRDQFERAIPIEVEISEDVQGRESTGGSTIPPKVRLAMYRVSEEALGNIVKHSGATGANGRRGSASLPQSHSFGASDRP